jgi:hypothetical protein
MAGQGLSLRRGSEAWLLHRVDILAGYRGEPAAATCPQMSILSFRAEAIETAETAGPQQTWFDALSSVWHPSSLK